MNIFVWIIMISIFLYTIGYSIELWKDKNKVGSFAVFTLALSIVVVPFLSVLR
ncbi:hypothetical protein [Peribacillus frigoritolerans]|uniref:hypothetical protein n=1 Tax=Peribacillus frigoritolerans TaxID=450367 RepID=UPI00399F0840